MFLALCLVAVSSCSKDFLDVVPVDRIPKDQFFKTEQDLITAVNGVYAAHRIHYSGGERQFYNIHETRSDNTHQKLARQTEDRALDDFTAQSGNNAYLFYWANAYNCINLANAVIDRAGNVEMDATMKNRLVGEAKFLRAHVYFLLVQAFGGVPLRLSETTSLSGDNNLVKSSVADVYAQIVSDLEAASQGLPASHTGSDIGRATSGAAYAMLGKAQLQAGNKAAAIEALRQVVKPGSVYSLLPSYSDLWIPSNKNHAESIFEVQFLPPLSGSPFYNTFTPLSMNVPGGNNGNLSPNTPTSSIISEFEVGDERLEASIAYDPTNRPYIVKFRDPAVQVANTARNNFPVLRYADAMLLLAEALGETEESYDLINQVRNRAGLADVDASSPGTFMEKILHERRVEFAFETHRWADLLRILSPGQFVEHMNAHLASEFPGQGIEIDSHDLLNPIPVTEMATNALMEQNPGY